MELKRLPKKTPGSSCIANLKSVRSKVRVKASLHRRHKELCVVEQEKSENDKVFLLCEEGFVTTMKHRGSPLYRS